ncbi:hypothetical protein FRB90_011447 [Tulasnella sp. 427]|nr:hypothetical protein FRB90_011447 [Tulasnella sp. 427]
MSEIEEGRRAALDIVKSQDVDVLVIQFAAGAVPPPEEIFEFFERITGLQQLHFFTPTFAQVGRPAYYRRDARLPPNPAQEGSAAHEEDTPSDTSEVDEEMREAALRYLLPERALEAIRAAKAAREATGLGDKKSDDRGIMASKQNRKRKRDDVEEMPLHASRDAPDTVDLKTTKREKKRSKKERKGKTTTEVMDSDDNRQAVSENEQSISQKSHRRPNNASTEDLAQGVVTMRDDQTSPVISESKESSPQKKEKKRDPSAMVERSVSAPDSVDSPSQDQYALDAAASGHDEQASGTKRKKEKKRRREREKPQPAEDASLAEPGDVEQSGATNEP